MNFEMMRIPQQQSKHGIGSQRGWFLLHLVSFQSRSCSKWENLTLLRLYWTSFKNTTYILTNVRIPCLFTILNVSPTIIACDCSPLNLRWRPQYSTTSRSNTVGHMALFSILQTLPILLMTLTKWHLKTPFPLFAKHGHYWWRIKRLSEPPSMSTYYIKKSHWANWYYLWHSFLPHTPTYLLISDIYIVLPICPYNALFWIYSLWIQTSDNRVQCLWYVSEDSIYFLLIHYSFDIDSNLLSSGHDEQGCEVLTSSLLFHQDTFLCFNINPILKQIVLTLSILT